MKKKKAPKSPAEAKEELKRKVNAMIDELFEWAKEHPDSNFTGMEEEILKVRRRIGEEGIRAILEIQEKRRPVDSACPKCGKTSRYKDMQGITIVSRAGEVRIERGYYHCKDCREGDYPLDRQLQLEEKHWSEGVAYWMTWLNGHTLTYGESEEVVEMLTDAAVSKSSGWRLVQEHGAKMGEEIVKEEQQIQAASHEWSTPGGKVAPLEKMGIATDGGKMYILGEGWKEFKAGCVFEVDGEIRPAPHSEDWEEYGHAVALSYTVHLGGPEVAGRQLWTEAQRRGLRRALAVLVLGDGAPWIWNLRDEHFPEAEMLVDWYHAIEHLGAAKQCLFPEEDAVATRWFNAQETALYQGHADQVARALQTANERAAQPNETVARAIEYFRSNQRRMQYQRLREDGWPIGSGMMESGVKRFKARFTAGGMRWSRAGAENLLPVRAAVLSGKARFDALWQRAYAA